MTMIKKPAERYIHRKTLTEAIQVRCDSKLKKQAESAAKTLKTSVARFTEAAILHYIDALKKEGIL